MHAPDDPDPSPSAKGPLDSEEARDKLLRWRTIVLDHTLTDDSANRIAASLLWLEQDDPLTDIVLLISCSGGSVSAGFAIIDFMHYVSCDVVTYVTGLAAGMGHMILASGAKGKRYALPHSHVVMRRPQAAGKSERHVHDQIRSVRLEVARITAEQTGHSVEEVLQDLDTGRQFDAEEARAYGFVDEVVRQRKPLTRRPPDLDRDADGNTHLHRAYLSGDESTVDELLVLGANPTLPNSFGLTPPQMAEVRLAKSQFLELASLVNPEHSWSAIILGPPGRPDVRRPDRTWTDRASAARLCALLRDLDVRVYALALTKAMETGDRRPILKSAIKVGRSESLIQLEDLLNRYGTREIVLDYLNCGSPELARAGRQLAHVNGLRITEFPGSGGHGAWGSG
ncbi:ATP-dependent Clp protease proteolytic subunit [Nonomuraea sp. NPDC046802]|uniref:ClpP family protease n=1 Tax=Nonomuraea sp. NPDC046802 TaxID=3154919 RepID=UPI0033CEBACC